MSVRVNFMERSLVKFVSLCPFECPASEGCIENSYGDYDSECSRYNFNYKTIVLQLKPLELTEGNI